MGCDGCMRAAVWASRFPVQYNLWLAYDPRTSKQVRLAHVLFMLLMIVAAFCALYFIGYLWRCSVPNFYSCFCSNDEQWNVTSPIIICIRVSAVVGWFGRPEAWCTAVLACTLLLHWQLELCVTMCHHTFYLFYQLQKMNFMLYLSLIVSLFAVVVP